MRLAMLGDYPSDPTKIGGGVEAVLTYLVQGLRQFSDLEIHIVSLRNGLDRVALSGSDGVSVHHVPAAYRLANVTFFALNKLRLFRVLRTIDPDLIHAHIAGTYSQVAFRMGCPAVLTAHGVRYREAQIKAGLLHRLVRRPLTTYDERRGIRVAKHMISISPYIEQEFRSIIRGKVYAIENPVSDAFFDIPDRTEPNRVLFAGHIGPRKGVLFLLEAIERLRSQIPDLQVYLAGNPALEYDSTYPARVQAYVDQNGLASQVHFVGQLDELALREQYAKCAILVLPARQETAPMVVEQAMAAGKAVVATRTGGVPYLVDHGRTGLLVDFGDVAALAEAMHDLLTDDTRRQHMGGQAAIEANKRFRTSVVAAKTYEVYRQVAGAV